MHISEGVLSAPVLLGGAALTLAGVIRGLRSVSDDDIPKAAILAAFFFTASLIHVPLGPSSAHLIMSGVIGLLLGWAAFPVIFVGLLLQGVLFQFGGLTVLGVNTFNMAGPAVLLGLALRVGITSQSGRITAVVGFICGGGAVFLSGLMVAVCLRLSGNEFRPAAWAVFIGNLPVAMIEGMVSLFCVQFIRKVRPDLLRRRPGQKVSEAAVV